MKNKELIIELIQQDLKHSQLLYGLDEIGLCGTELYFLEISEIVYRLMNVSSGEMGDHWMETYMNFMRDTVNYEISHSIDVFKPLAYACYIQLELIVLNS
ncbi:hypothetical protein ACSTS3_06200 [Aquimarina muelleri]|uniref:hypothetical protein n=1 Tax=Aquimarina muelleri TaxID=279356 RepID=UPI003F68256A